MLWLAPDIARLFPELRSVDAVFHVAGETVRAPPKTGRETLRVERGGRGFYLKRHRGVGWREIFKNLSTLKRPVLGAINEWQAIQRLERIGIATMPLLGYGQTGFNPAARRSFVLTGELLRVVSLEDHCREWARQPPPVEWKWRLIRAVAELVGRLHRAGVNHRDLYLCHLLLECGSESAPRLHLIDLHRVQLRARVPRRWLVRDLAALWFSSMDIGLTRRDLLRFLRCYGQQPLRQQLADARFWQRVQRRAEQLAAKGNRG